MIPVNNSWWFIRQKQLDESFEASHAPVIAESKVSTVIRLLKQNGKVTAYEIMQASGTTDPRTVARRLKKRGIISHTTYEKNATGNSNHAVYHYKGEK